MDFLLRWRRSVCFGRRTFSDKCAEVISRLNEKKETNRLYHLQHKDRLNESKRLYRLLNKDKLREAARWKKDERQDYEARYQADNESKLKSYHRQYHLENVDKLTDAKRRLRTVRRSELKAMHAIDVEDNGNELDYRSRNRDKIGASKRQYELRHAGKIKEAKRLYHLSNKDKLKDAVHRYGVRNQEKIRASKSRYRKLNMDRIRESKRRYFLENHDNPESYAPREFDSKSWKSPELVREYFDSISEALLISKHDDWYRISREQINNLGGNSLFTRFESLGLALRYAYPEINWDLSKFSQVGKKSEQRRLKRSIESLLPGVEILENFLHPELVWGNSDRHIECDLWIPQYRIALEYQGMLHSTFSAMAYNKGSTTSTTWKTPLGQAEQ